MKTLEQIKDDYVRDKYLSSHDLDTWLDFQNFFANRHPEWFEVHWEEVMKIYAMECLKLASENAYCETGNNQFGYFSKVAKESITNENNIIK